MLGDADVGSRSVTNTAILREPQRQRHGAPGLEKPSNNWNVLDKYVELLNFELVVTNIIKTKT